MRCAARRLLVWAAAQPPRPPPLLLLLLLLLLLRRQWRLPVLQHLKPGTNRLSIVIDPAATVAAGLKRSHAYDIPTMQVPGGLPVFNFARKPAFDFGWVRAWAVVVCCCCRAPPCCCGPCPVPAALIALPAAGGVKKDPLDAGCAPCRTGALHLLPVVCMVR
jgi:hypothetical protein